MFCSSFKTCVSLVGVGRRNPLEICIKKLPFCRSMRVNQDKVKMLGLPLVEKSEYNEEPDGRPACDGRVGVISVVNAGALTMPANIKSDIPFVNVLGLNITSSNISQTYGKALAPLGTDYRGIICQCLQASLSLTPLSISAMKFP